MYCVLASPYPSQLREVVDYVATAPVCATPFATPLAHIHDDHVRVLSRRWRESELGGSQGPLNFKPVHEAIQEYDALASDVYKGHGLFLDEGAFWANRSCLFWCEDAPGGQVHINFYSNMKHESASIMNAEAFQRRVVRRWLKAFSRRITPEPVSPREAREIIRERFPVLASRITQGIDPYVYLQDQSREESGIARKIYIMANTLSLRTLQSLGVRASKVDRKKLLTGMALGWVVASATSVAMALLLAVKVGKAQALSRLMRSAIALINKHMAAHDSSLRTDDRATHGILAHRSVHEEFRGRFDVFNHRMLRGIALGDLRHWDSSLLQAADYTSEDQVADGAKILLDTGVGAIGGLARQGVRMGREIVYVEHPSGVDVTLCPRLGIARARIARAP